MAFMVLEDLKMEENKRILITGVKKAEIVDTPMPAAAGVWAVVKVRAIPLCTEYKGWLTGSHYPGHEAAGEVVEVSGPGSKVQVGDRVVVMPQNPCGVCDLCKAGEYIHCQDTCDFQAETGLDTNGDTHVRYLPKQDWLLIKIPDGMPFDLAALACCGLGPTFGALETLNAGVFDTVLITGAGPVGLGGVVNARYRNAKVISVDPIKYRREKALELGANLAIDPDNCDIQATIKEFTGGYGVTAALETSGTNGGARICVDALRPRGKMAFIGENGEFLIRISDDFIRKGITVIGQWHYNLNGTGRILEVIQNSPAAAKLITHRFPASKINEALAISAEHQCGKIIIDPWN